jgi:hypothetical protein
MPANEFPIVFTFDEVKYFGIIRPLIAGHRTIYRVILETVGEVEPLEFILKPSHSDLDQWEYESGDDMPAKDLDQGFLSAVIDRVSQCLGRNSGQPV